MTFYTKAPNSLVVEKELKTLLAAVREPLGSSKDDDHMYEINISVKEIVQMPEPKSESPWFPDEIDGAV